MNGLSYMKSFLWSSLDLDLVTEHAISLSTVVLSI